MEESCGYFLNVVFPIIEIRIIYECERFVYTMREIVDDIYTVRLIFFRCVSDIYNKKIPYYFNQFMEVLKMYNF